MKLNDFDPRNEAFRLRVLQRDLERAEREGLAVQAALSEHSVVSFVKGLPVGPSLYPAIEYLKQSKRSEIGKAEGHQERKAHFREHEYIHWCMPTHDQERPKQKGCGFIISKNGGGLVHSACPNDKEHFIKGKRRHCWSLRCPQCMNDTALKRGIEIEKRLLEFKGLSRKQGIDVGDIWHWVVSPPQDLMKGVMQTKPAYNRMSVHIDSSMQVCGAAAGFTIFHPWRQKESEWEFSPHFHILCYGRVHRNTYFCSPGHLDAFYKIIGSDCYLIGQISGIDGYAAAISSGYIAAQCIMHGAKIEPFSPSTMMGALAHYVSNTKVTNFQPMGASFSLLLNKTENVLGVDSKQEDLME